MHAHGPHGLEAVWRVNVHHAGGTAAHSVLCITFLVSDSAAAVPCILIATAKQARRPRLVSALRVACMLCILVVTRNPRTPRHCRPATSRCAHHERTTCLAPGSEPVNCPMDCVHCFCPLETNNNKNNLGKHGRGGCKAVGNKNTCCTLAQDSSLGQNKRACVGRSGYGRQAPTANATATAATPDTAAAAPPSRTLLGSQSGRQARKHEQRRRRRQ